MRMVIVPNELRDAINAELDAALKDVPEAAANRAEFYQMMLEYFDEHGVIPNVSIKAAVLSDQPT